MDGWRDAVGLIYAKFVQGKSDIFGGYSYRTSPRIIFLALVIFHVQSWQIVDTSFPLSKKEPRICDLTFGIISTTGIFHVLRVRS